MVNHPFGKVDPLTTSKRYLAGTARSILARRADVFLLLSEGLSLSRGDVQKISKKHAISKYSVAADLTLYRSLWILLNEREKFVTPKTTTVKKALELFCEDSPLVLAKEEKVIAREVQETPVERPQALPVTEKKETLIGQPPVQIIFSSIAHKLELAKEAMEDLQEENQDLKKRLERLTNQNKSLQMRLSEKEAELKEVESLTNQLYEGEVNGEKKAILILGKASNGLKIVKSTNFTNDIKEISRTGILARAVKEINKYFSHYDKAYPSYRVRQILHGELSGLNMVTIMKRYRLVYEVADGKIILQNFFHRKELRRVVDGAISSN